ncbi:MAG: protein kinase [Acidobacteriota bacterium]
MTPEDWQQIVELYHSARGLTPLRREPLLAGLDPDVRREVEALLATSSVQVQEALDPTLTMIGVGSELGPYRIEAPLGKGGMGEVFQGVDTRLGRRVAIKISHAQFSERFQREARAISSLNHPHICTLYDVGTSPSGVGYLVMELVEGETLAVKLKRGKLALQETVQYGSQIADALAAAHAKGITHRDLKPGNIMIAKAGVKVLDFGLAKVEDDEPLTVANAVMGTPAYMAPEQREGRPADPRADIYSLGLMLCEMATGKRLTQGETPQLSGIPQFAHVTERCLEKNPEDRWQSAADLKKELLWASAIPQVSSMDDRGATRLKRWIWTAAGIAVLAAGIGWMGGARSAPTASVRSFRLEVNAPPGTEFEPLAGAAMSPDGRTIAFVAKSPGGTQLWVRDLNSTIARELPGTNGATFPFWSPNNKALGFFAGGKLQRIDVSAGMPSILSEGVYGRGGTWNEDGMILFNAVNDGPLMRVSATGGKLELLTTMDIAHQESSHRWPQFLPDGKHFLYFVRSMDPGRMGMYWASLDQPNERVRVLESASHAVYAHTPGGQTGHLLWVNDGHLLAQPFDPVTGKLSGESASLAEGVGQSNVGSILSDVWASNEGTLLYANRLSELFQLTWYGRDGRIQGTVGQAEAYQGLRVAPDGKRVALARAGNVWQIELARGTETRVTVDGGKDPLVWSPDGERIVYGRGAPPNLFEKSVTGVLPGERVTDSRDSQGAWDWSRDGRFLLFHTRSNDITSKTASDLWYVPMTGDRKPSVYVQTPFNERQPRFSPDGKWVAYMSDESGRDEVYVQSFPESKPKWRVSKKGGTDVRWSKNGKELVYLASDGWVMAVPVHGVSAGLEFGSPTELFKLDGSIPRPSDGTVPLDLTPDGERFLGLARVGDARRGMTVITDWHQEFNSARAATRN